MERNLRKTRTGKVVSDKMDKTIVVAIEDHVKHPVIGKIVKKTVKLKAHDENNECGIGDTVKVMETRPLSKDKSKSRKSIIFEDKIIFRLVHGNFRTSSRIVIKKIDIISHGSSIGYTNESRSTRNGDFHGGLGKKKVRERGWVWSIGIANYSGGAGEKTNNDGNNGRITVMC